MPTLAIEDFRHGLDVRKSPLTAAGGSLQRFTNCVLTNGGEVEKRRAFVNLGQLPTYMSGLFGSGGELHAWGSNPAGTDVVVGGQTIRYHRLNTDILRVFDVEVYGGKFWVSAWGLDLSVKNYWDNVERTGASRYSRVYQSKLYRTEGTLLRFSTIDDPSLELNTPDHPGGGFIDVAKNDSEVEDLSGLEVYYNKLAVFARYATQIWTVDPDPALNTLQQVIRTGSIAPHAIKQFGTGDVLFLSDSGIRSLRALNISMAAGVIDVGSPIDALIQADIAANFGLAGNARAAVQPITGRFFLALGGTVYVLSFFPAAKISAWSTFTIPFAVDAWAVRGNQLFCLDSVNNLYVYGGLDGNTFDSSEARIRTPHHANEKPSVVKKLQSLSGTVSGTWSVGLGLLSDNTELFEPVATLTGPSTTNHRIPLAGHGTHMALELVSTSASKATISGLALNYEENERL